MSLGGGDYLQCEKWGAKGVGVDAWVEELGCQNFGVEK